MFIFLEDFRRTGLFNTLELTMLTKYNRNILRTTCDDRLRTIALATLA
jgi:hypothetical protein